MTADELIDNARYLLLRNPGPTEADIRRAGSSAYYALFHEISRRCADIVMGASAAGQDRKAWQQTYRCLEHRHIKSQIERKKSVLGKFSIALQDFANTINELQDFRHTCDYDPYNTPTLINVNNYVLKAESALQKLRLSDQDEAKKLCVFLMFKHRN